MNFLNSLYTQYKFTLFIVAKVAVHFFQLEDNEIYIYYTTPFITGSSFTGSEEEPVLRFEIETSIQFTESAGDLPTTSTCAT